MNLENFQTKDLVTIWNAFQKANDGNLIKKFADRKTAEKRVSKLVDDIGDNSSMIKKTRMEISQRQLQEKFNELFIVQSEPQKAIRADGKYQRKNPTFKNDNERYQYITTQYATKTDHFPGRKSQFSGLCLSLSKQIDSPFREGTVVNNSFQIIASNPGIAYEEFRQSGGRNTDLVAMVQKKIVKTKKQKR